MLHHFHRRRVVGTEAGKNKKARPAHMTNRACNLQQKTCPFTERTGNFLLVPGTTNSRRVATLQSLRMSVTVSRVA